MSAFEPINPDHAIAAVAFSVNFNRPLEVGEIANARKIEPEVNEFLPGTTLIPRDPPRPPLPFFPVTVGFMLHRVKPDGKPAWVLTAHQNSISAQCTEYTRWADVWGRVRTWLMKLYNLVKRSDLLITSVSLQYKDEFSATKPLDSDVLEKLFKVDSQYLPSRTFNNKELWHINQGWYLPETAPTIGNKLNVKLNVLNIATREVGNSIVLVIDHLSRFQMDNPSELFSDCGDRAPIDVVMEELHVQNKSLLRNLLSPQMARRIRLDG